MFNKNVVEFSIKGINMIGNCNNGSIIGLSNDGKELVETLKKKDHLAELNTDTINREQCALIESLKSQGYFDPPSEIGLQSAYLHVTNDCNLHCLGCYSHNSERNKENALSYDEICLALRKLKKMGLENVIISGGEPFLRKDIYDIYKYIKDELHISGLQVITNGTISNMYDAKKINKWVDELNISIDGYSEDNPTFIRDAGIFRTIFDNVKHLKKSGVNLKLIATIHRKNIDMAGEYVNLSQRTGVPISFSMLTCAGDFDDFEHWIPTQEQLIRYGHGEIKGIDKIYSEAKGSDFIVTARKTCGMGQRLISIGSDGNVYPCHMAHLSDAILGNILEDSITEIKNRCAQFVESIGVDDIRSCSNCEYKYVCGGGCRARALTMYGDIGAKDDYCVLNKTYFKSVFERLLNEINSRT